MRCVVCYMVKNWLIDAWDVIKKEWWMPAIGLGFTALLAGVMYLSDVLFGHPEYICGGMMGVVLLTLLGWAVVEGLVKRYRDARDYCDWREGGE